MPAQRYTSRRITVTAIQWTGGNLEAIKDFAGDDFLHADGTVPVVRQSAGPWPLALGDWISREDGKALFVHSEAAWARMWDPAEEA
jgi:hypothetical protein